MKKAKEALGAFLAVAAFYYVLKLLNIGCPIKFLTGISCAGCGMTRAWEALLRLNIEQAFYYHPLFYFPPIFLFILIFKTKINKHLYKMLIFTIILIFGIIYAVRLVYGESDIVVCKPQEGFVYKILQMILGRKKNVL